MARKYGFNKFLSIHGITYCTLLFFSTFTGERWLFETNDTRKRKTAGQILISMPVVCFFFPLEEQLHERMVQVTSVCMFREFWVGGLLRNETGKQVHGYLRNSCGLWYGARAQWGVFSPSIFPQHIFPSRRADECETCATRDGEMARSIVC